MGIKRIGRFLSLGLILALLTMLFPTANPALADDLVTLKIMPSLTTIGTNADFTVSVNARDALDSADYNFADLNDYSFDIGFDPTVMQLGSAGVTGGSITNITTNGTITTPMTVTASFPQTGTIRVTHAHTSIGAAGTGYLAQIAFHVLTGTEGRSSAISIANIVLKFTGPGGSQGGDIPFGSPLNGQIKVSYPPVNVSISIPDQTSPDQIPSGDSFTARINVSLLHNLNAFQFDLSYNPSVLQINGVESGAAGVTNGQIGSTLIPMNPALNVGTWSYYPLGTPGVIRVVGYIPSDGLATGSGYLADVHFNVIGHSGQSSALQFTSVPGFADNLYEFTKGDILPELVTWTGTRVTIISAYRITNTTLANGETGIGYHDKLLATGGNAPYTFSVLPGSTLPDGLELDSTGQFSGTPTTPGGPTQITFRVTDGASAVNTKTLPITIVGPPAIISGSNLPDGQTGVIYSQNIFASGGQAPYTWSVLSGALPDGVSLSSTGAIAGMPGTAGSSTFTAKVTDVLGGFGTQVFHITITAGPAISNTSLRNGEINKPYSQSLGVTGGTPPYTWSIVAGSLPANLTFSTSGLISGTPINVGGPVDISFKVTDNAGAATTKSLSLTIAGAPFISTASLTSGELTLPYSQTLAMTGGVAPFNWTATSNLPAGLLLNASTGAISGTPTAAGSPSVTFTVTDSYGASTSKTLTISIVTAPTISTLSLPTGEVGVSYSQTLTATGGATPYTWAIQSGSSLPAGLSLNSVSGLISGSPTSAGTSNFTVQLTDKASGSVTKPFSITVNSAPSISTTSLPNGEAGVAYSQTLVVSGGTPSYVWTLISGTLPTNLLLNAVTGAISGTPGGSSSNSLTFKVTDSKGASVTQTLTLTIIASPLISNASPLPTGEVNINYTQALSVTGGAASYTWSIFSGALPAGLTLNPASGVISGLPTLAGSLSAMFKVTDSLGGSSSKQLVIPVVASPAISTSTLPGGQTGVTYSQALAVQGGVGPYSWSIQSGILPNGLTLNSAGVISGTPTVVGGPSTVTFKVTDGLGGSNTRDLSITIYNSPFIANDTLATGEVSRPYAQTLVVNGGVSPFTWVVQSGTLPSGVGLNSSSGLISGTPLGVSSNTITFRVTDNLGVTVTKALTLTVVAAPSIATTSLPNGEVNMAYSQALAVTPGTGVSPFSWTLTGGSLPGGLGLDAGIGIISGIPNTAGTFISISIKVTDNLGGTNTRTFSITVIPAPSITTTTLGGGETGVAYSKALTAVGGQTPYSWSLISGALPGGLSLTANTGAIAGTPNATGTASFIVKVTDSLGGTAQQNLTLTISDPPVITNTSLPVGEVSRSYGQTLVVNGGVSPFTWVVQSGTLPSGLVLTAGSGLISGTPLGVSSNTITFRVTDSLGVAVTKSLTLTVVAAPSIATTSLPNGEVNLAYSQALAVTPGTGVSPFNWTLTGGSLPGGLGLDAGAGIISGIPNTAGTFLSISIKVTDNLGGTNTRTFSITVIPPPSITTTTLGGGETGVAYSKALTAVGGQTPYSWSLISGALPGGLSLTANTGAIAGTPNATGTASFTVKVRDNLGGTAQQNLTLTISDPPVITNTLLPVGEVSRSYGQTLVVNGGVSPFTWVVQSGTLPSGLVLTYGSGLISGTPSGVSSNTITFRVTDSLGAIATKALTLTVVAAPSIATTSLPNGEVNLAYSQALALTPGTGVSPYSWTLTGGSLPGGLGLGTGVISGTPNAAGTFSSITFQVTDSLGGTNTRTFSITVIPAPSITTTTLGGGETGVTYSKTLTAVGGQTPYSWSLISGALPGGLSLTANTGAIAGTPNATGTASFTVKVTDSLGGTAQQNLTLTISDPPVISNSVLAVGEVSRSYGQTLVVNGGVSPFTWVVQAGTLPSGLTLSATTGAITGTPAAIGSAGITFRVTDSLGVIATKALTLTVVAAPSIATTSLPNGEVNLAYSQALAVTPGTGVSPYSWTLTGGSLPGGLGLDAGTGVISGTPNAAGTSSLITFQVTDSLGGTNTKTFSITVVTAPAITSTSLATGEINVAYSKTLTATGGATPYTWTLQSGAWPAGLSLNTNTGVIAGTPTVAVISAPLTVKMTDSLGGVSTQGLTLTIASVPVITDNAVAIGNVGVAYSQSLTVSGGVSPFTWTVQSGTLPNGLTLSTTGLLSGTPTAAGGPISVTFKVADSFSVSALKTLSITIVVAPNIDSASPLANGEVNVAYSQTLAASGGVMPYTWTITSGALPGGLSLSAGGTVSGNATQSGDFTITITLTDSFNPPHLVSKAFSIRIFAEVGITNSSLAEVLKGKPYSQSINASGGMTSYTWNAAGLPAGLTISAAGVISGTPTVYGNFNIVITVTDAMNHSTTKNLTIKVYMPYDANGNGFIDMGDAVKIERIILLLDPPTPASDADGDSLMTVADITKLERIILELDPAE